jgi:hypothetical protein
MIDRYYAAYVRVGPAYKFVGMWPVESGEEDIEFSLAEKKLNLRSRKLLACIEVGSRLKCLLLGFVFHAQGDTSKLRIVCEVIRDMENLYASICGGEVSSDSVCTGHDCGTT